LGRQHFMRNVDKAVFELSDKKRFGDVWESAAKETDPRKWAQESHELCDSFVYDAAILNAVRATLPGVKLKKIELPDRYYKEAGEHARRRIVAAGVRLARLLDGPQPNVTTSSAAPANNTSKAVISFAFNRAKAGDEREVASVKLCWCPSGKFTMGSPPGEPERRPGEDQVEVALTKGFWMGKYEATQGQWKRVVGKLPGELTAELPEGDDFPVGNVNFAEAEAFCEKLTELGHQSGDLPKDWEFRLPTEAQWEYACRAGTTTATSFGERLSSQQANFKGKPYNGAEPGPSLNRATKVGSYPANAWRLHDMHGNIYEWCRDWYHARLPGGMNPDLYAAKASATQSEHGGVSRVRRGGCWADEGWPCRSAFRLRFEPERRYDHIGFRVVAVQK